MSFSETIFLFFLALIIFGPKKLPEIARQVGKYLNEFRRASNEFKAQIEQEIAHLDVEHKPTVLPTSSAPEYTTSRTLHAAELDSTPAEPAATLAASSEEPESAAGDSDEEKQSGATEAIPSDTVTSSTQESHA